VIFASDRRLRQIDGVQNTHHFIAWKFLHLLKSLFSHGYSGCTLLTKGIFIDYHLQRITEFRKFASPGGIKICKSAQAIFIRRPSSKLFIVYAMRVLADL
jgi:hypothetical protein